MINSKTREQLIKMYIECLKENKIPWQRTWKVDKHKNGISNIEYKGVNELLLNLIASLFEYKDSRWFTYVQIQRKGWKLKKEAKGRGVPLEFWSMYNFKQKRKYEIKEYKNYIKEHPEEKEDFRMINNVYYVFNADLVDGITKEKSKNIDSKEIPKKIKTIIKNLNVKYIENGNNSFYDIENDKIVLPSSDKFFDNYSYYATQLHEISHATGHPKRLNRKIENRYGTVDYAREELVAEISSSFLMQDMNIIVEEKHYENHKAYIQSWIELLESNPKELFDAISKASKVCEYIDEISKIKNREMER